MSRGENGTDTLFSASRPIFSSLVVETSTKGENLSLPVGHLFLLSLGPLSKKKDRPLFSLAGEKGARGSAVLPKR